MPWRWRILGLALVLLMGLVTVAKADDTVVIPKVLDLNTATAAELDDLPGVGRKRAEAIVGERTRRPFRRVTELLRIKGFGPKLYAKVRPLVTVGGGHLGAGLGL